MVVSCSSNPYAKGEDIYILRCASCHMPDGSGLANNIPPLINSSILANNSALVCVITNGRKSDPLDMPSNIMEDIPLANLINFIKYRFISDEVGVRLDSVKVWKKNCINE